MYEYSVSHSSWCWLVVITSKREAEFCARDAGWCNYCFCGRRLQLHRQFGWEVGRKIFLLWAIWSWSKEENLSLVGLLIMSFRTLWLGVPACLAFLGPSPVATIGRRSWCVRDWRSFNDFCCVACLLEILIHAFTMVVYDH